MALSFLYLAFVRILGLVLLGRRDDNESAVEVHRSRCTGSLGPPISTRLDTMIVGIPHFTVPQPGASACGPKVAGLASAHSGALCWVRDASFGWANQRGGELRR
jgi:hypothetical protein